MSLRLVLPNRRLHITQKVGIPGRMLYISVHDDPAPAELFLRVKGLGCISETIALYDVLPRLASIALQQGSFSYVSQRDRSTIILQTRSRTAKRPSVNGDGRMPPTRPSSGLGVPRPGLMGEGIAAWPAR